ncbi:hypothetical protein KBC40_01700 [Patescibacteria group bacterium]|jgi:hypothetical protein|nr:hypothetical protein [Patescibacteria group bacterium]
MPEEQKENQNSEQVSNEINSIVNQEIGKDKPLELNEDSVHVMPAKFLPQSPKKQLSAKQKIIFIVIAFVLFLIFVVSSMLWWASSSVPEKNTTIPVDNNIAENEVEQELEVISHDQKILDDLENLKLALNRYFSLNQKYPVYLADLQPTHLSVMPNQADGSPYVYMSIKGAQDFKFKITLDGSANAQRVGAYQFTSNGLSVYTADDETDNGVVDNNGTEITPPPPPPLTNNIDADQDSLTREEEALFGSNINDSDTDNDGYTDGMEVLNLYNPVVSGAALANSGLVTIFTDNLSKYRFLYPTSWVTDNTASLVSVLPDSELGDNFTVKVSPNSKASTLTAWAADGSSHPVLNSPSSLTLGKAKIPALKQEIDGDIVLVAVTDAYQLVITYDVNAQAERYFETVFNMMLNSFEFFN